MSGGVTAPGGSHTPTPPIWLAIGYGEGGADNRIVRSDTEMVDWLWDQCGPDHTGDEAITRVFWSTYVADADNWRRLDDVDRWWCTIDIGETGHIAFIRLLDPVGSACNAHAELVAALADARLRFANLSDALYHAATYSSTAQLMQWKKDAGQGRDAMDAALAKANANA